MDGLARALRTISDDREVLEVANRATQHLYIVNPIKSFEERAKSLWDTHPPIGERIRAIRARVAAEPAGRERQRGADRADVTRHPPDQITWSHRGSAPPS